MDKVFLDANVLFSVAYGSKGLRKFWELQEKGKLILFTSNYAVNEAKRNLEINEQVIFLEKILQKVYIFKASLPDLPLPELLPPKDMPILKAAIACEATHLVTGDIKHFGLLFGKTIFGVKIVTPKDYLMEK